MDKIWIKNNEFKQLTDDEVKKLKADELSLYVKDLNEHRVKQAQKEIEEKIKDSISKEDFEKLKASIDELNQKNADNLEIRIKEFERLAKEIAEKSKKQFADTEKLSGFELSLKMAKDNISGKEISSVLKDYKKGDKFSFSVKFISGDVTGNPSTPQLVPGIGQIPMPKFVLSNFFPISPIQPNNEGVASYDDWDEATTVAAAAAIAEGAVFPESTAKFTRKSITIEKVGDSISMSIETIRDYGRFVAELARFISRNVLKVVNQALWNGTGVTPNIAGLYTNAPALDTLTVTAKEKTSTPDIIDLVKVLNKRILNGADDKYMPNFAFVNHDDYLTLQLAKDTTGNLIYPNGVPMVGAIEIIPTSFVATNTMLVGDKNFVELIGDPNAIEIEAGYRTGDWENDKESIKARVRTALLLRDADKSGFLKVTDISAALVAITAV